MILIRKLLLILIILSIPLMTGGCGKYIRGRSEINEVIFTRVVGVDKGKGGNTKFTITSKSVESTGEKGAAKQTKKANILSAEGKTVFEALRNISSFADKKVFYGHTEFILISEEVAREGILPYLDFMARDYELRTNAKIYIVKGSSTGDLMEKTNTSSSFIADRLKSLEENAQGKSNSSKVPLLEVMNIFDKPFLSTYIPYIEMEKLIKKEGEDKDALDISLKGYAVFREDKLQGYLTEEQSRGLNWIRGLVESAVILVKGPKGDDISMEVINTSHKIIPKIDEDGNLSAAIKIGFSTNVAEIKGRENIFSKEDLDYVEKQQNKVVEKEIKDVIEYAQREGLDMFSMSFQFDYRYPMEWEKLEKNWSESFSDIKFDVKVESLIDRTYIITRPIGSKEGEIQ